MAAQHGDGVPYLLLHLGFILLDVAGDRTPKDVGRWPNRAEAPKVGEYARMFRVDPVRAPDRETGFFGTEVSEPGRTSGPPGSSALLWRNEHLSNDVVLESFYAS